MDPHDELRQRWKEEDARLARAALRSVLSALGAFFALGVVILFCTGHAEPLIGVASFAFLVLVGVLCWRTLGRWI